MQRLSLRYDNLTDGVTVVRLEAGGVLSGGEDRNGGKITLL